MGAAASINKQFAGEMKSRGFKDLILNADTDVKKLQVFNELQEEVRTFFAAQQIQAVARAKLANKAARSGGSLHEIFIKFCRFGKGQSTISEMDGKRWAKFCKENKFYTIKKSAFNATGADLVFAKVRMCVCGACGQCSMHCMQCVVSGARCLLLIVQHTCTAHHTHTHIHTTSDAANILTATIHIRLPFASIPLSPRCVERPSSCRSSSSGSRPFRKWLLDAGCVQC